MGIRQEVGLLTGRFLATKSRSHFAAEYSIGGLIAKRKVTKLG